MACWPTHAIICEMLMKEPLDPQRAMVSGLLVRWSSCLHDFPADSLITDSSWRTTDYRSIISNHHNLYKQTSPPCTHFSYSRSGGIISRSILSSDLQSLLCTAARLGLQLALLVALDKLTTLLIALCHQPLLLPHQTRSRGHITNTNGEPTISCKHAACIHIILALTQRRRECMDIRSTLT